MKKQNMFLTVAVSVSLFSVPSMAVKCNFKSIKTEIRGDVREVFKCRDAEAQDCEMLGSISKADMERYSKIVDQSRMTSDLFLMAVTAPVGGVALSASKAGGLLVRFGKDAWKSFTAPLGTTTPPFAGLLKKHIGETYGAKAAEIFSRSTYVASAIPFGGAIAATTDNVRNRVVDAAKFVAGDRPPSSQVADNALGANAGALKPDHESCADKGIKQLEQSLATVKSHENAESMMTQCMTMPLGGARAKCLHDAQKAAKNFFLVRDLGVDKAREAQRGWGNR